MGFFSPKVPTPTPAPPPPSRNDAEVNDAAKREREMAARRRGRSATILTDSVSAEPTVTRPTARSGAALLGNV